MAKFKNVSGFKQVVAINGSKTLVFPDDVVEMREEWKQAGFDPVSEETPVRITQRKGRNKSRFADNSTIESLQERLNEIESHRSFDDNELVEITDKLENITNETHVVTEEVKHEVEDLHRAVSELQKENEKQEELNTTILNRLEILKTAMQAMEHEMDQFYELYGNGEEVGN